MQQTRTHVLILLTISLIIFFTNLGTARLWDRDEPRNAGCAVEMMERGNLVVPIFNDELRPQKPALLYWLIISAYHMFGVSEFAARFWSAVLAIGTVLATYFIGKRLINATAALWGAIALSTSTMFVVASRAATPDSVLIFCSTMAMLLYVWGTFSSKKQDSDAPTLRWDGYFFPQQYLIVVAMYAFMGLAVLAKGPVGFLLPCAIIGMFMLLQRLPAIDNEKWNAQGWMARLVVSTLRPFHPKHFLKTVWAMRPITLTVTVLLVAAPWYVVVGLQTNWDWPTKFLFTENLARATSTFENHNGGWLYYPFAIMLGFFPWSIFFGPMALNFDRQMARKHHWNMTYCFLLCWIGVQIGLFSFAQTKLPSYVTPCYPALALLVGIFLQQLATNKTAVSANFHRWSFVTLIVSGVLIATAMVITGKIYLQGDLRLVLIGLIPVVAGGFAIYGHVSDRMNWTVNSCLAGSVSFAIATFGFGTVVVDQHQESQQILNHIANSDSDVPIATFGCLESSWVFYAQQPIFELSADVRRNRWHDNRQHNWHRKTWPSPEQFTDAHPNAMIITTNDRLKELQVRLPSNYKVIEDSPYFLKDQRLVLLAPETTKRVAATQENGQPRQH